MYFLRNTDTPHEDIQRGFSCHVNAWFDSLEEAQEWQVRNGALHPPVQDPKTGSWCADPETYMYKNVTGLGLSGFAFSDEKTFYQAIRYLEQYTIDNVAVFSSDQFNLGVGLDGEDIFKPEKYLGQILIDSSYADIQSLLLKRNPKGWKLNPTCPYPKDMCPYCDES